MLAWIWRSRLTWRATVPLTAALCLSIVVTAGIGGIVGGAALITSAVIWLLLLSRMSDNEARHIAAVAREQGRTPPESRVRRLLFPWWGRALLAFGVLAVTVAAALAFESDGVVVLAFALALAVSWLFERAVIALRSPG